MIKDFRIMPRGSGKTRLALEQACRPNSLVVVPFTGALDRFRGCNAIPATVLTRHEKANTIIFDDLFLMNERATTFILDNLDNHDFYIYTSIHIPTDAYPEFTKLLQLITTDYPEFLI